MTRLLTILAVLGILAMALPVHAGMVAVGDNDLAAISGKDNNFVAASTNDSITMTGANGNIQVGSYQWNDLHTADGSHQKAANFFNSSSAGANQAQENVVANINEINWGAAANSNTVTADMSVTGGISQNAGTFTASGDVDVETWGTLYIGGF